MLARAAEAGVDRVLSVGLDGEGNLRQVDLAAEFEQVRAAIGRHPNQADGFDDSDALAIRELAARPEVVAIGETGLDFYREGSAPETQRRAFSAQIGIARDLELPLVVHLRDREGSEAAVSEAFETLDREADGVPVVLHCFSAPDRVGEATGRGWFCSFAGNVTYPGNGALRAAAAAVPDDLILVETDAPYLTPQARRKARNEPAFVVETAACVAAERGIPAEELDRLVTDNARRLFGW